MMMCYDVLCYMMMRCAWYVV